MSRRSWVGRTPSARESDVVAALADLAGINEYFTVGTGPVRADWLPVEQLYTDVELLARAVGGVQARLGTTEWRVAASTFFLGFTARLWSVGIGTIVGHGLLPDLSPDLLLFHETGALHLARPVGWRDGDLTSRLAAAVLDGHVAPLSAALRRCGSISRKLLVGNAASALMGAAGAYEGATGVTGPARHLARRLCDDERLSSAIRFTGSSYRRTSCCLYYRTPTGGLCGDCALTAKPAIPGRKDAL